MRIGQVAKSAGIGVETVRFYESKGLISKLLRPANGGYRDYPTDTVHRIRFIRTAQRLGFSLQEIDELLSLESSPETQCVDIRRRAETKRREVMAKIENLTQIKAALDALIDACPGKGPARACSILNEIKSGDPQFAPINEGE